MVSYLKLKTKICNSKLKTKIYIIKYLLGIPIKFMCSHEYLSFPFLYSKYKLFPLNSPFLPFMLFFCRTIHMWLFLLIAQYWLSGSRYKTRSMPRLLLESSVKLKTNKQTKNYSEETPGKGRKVHGLYIWNVHL